MCHSNPKIKESAKMKYAILSFCVSCGFYVFITPLLLTIVTIIIIIFIIVTIIVYCMFDFDDK